MENKFEVDAGDHDKAFMHVGDTDDIEDEDNDKEDQAVPEPNVTVSIHNNRVIFQIVIDHNGVGTELEPALQPR